MIRIANATFDDLAYIASWLCSMDRMELSVTRDPDDYVTLAEDADRSLIKHVALDHACVPVFAFGAHPLDENTAHVWGFKTPAGIHAIRTVTKYLEHDMIPALRAIGVVRAVCSVHRDNTASQRWLVHLGFRPKATPGELGTPLILYQRDEPIEHLSSR
jgi:hypothetical protein